MDNVIDIKDKAKPPKAASSGGSGGGWDINLETRVGNLEAKVDKIDGRLGNIERILFEIQSELKHKASSEDVARIESKLDTKATSADLAKIDSKLDSKASKEDVLKSEGEIKSRIALVEGKVDGLPKWIQLISLTILGAGIIGAMNFFLTFYLKSPIK